MISSFKKLKVLELASVLAGPSVGMFLRELGAEVTKVESPKGDVTRTWKSTDEWPEKSVSAYYASINYDKKVVVLDLKNPKDRAQLDPLIAGADILIENFRSDSRKRLGLDPETLSKINPSLIHAHLGGFEEDEKRVAYDLVVQAETGFMSINGEQNGGPLKMPVALMDVLAAHQMKEGILAALYERASTGKGAYVSCSLEMSGMVSLFNQSANYLNHGKVAQRMGSLHPNIAPYGETFVCKDGKEVVLAIGSNAQFNALCKIIQDEALAEDSRFKENSGRLLHRSALAVLLAKNIQVLESYDFLKACHEAHVPAGAVRSIDEVMSLNYAQSSILEDTEDGQLLKRMKSVAFRYSPSSGKRIS